MSRTIRIWISLVLSALAVFSAAAGLAEAGTEAPPERATIIEKAVAEGGAAALWELVNPRYTANRYQEEGCAELYVWSPDVPAFAVRNASDYHPMNFFSVRIQETAGVGIRVERVSVYSVAEDGTYETAEYSLANGWVHLDPFGSVGYSVAGPANRNCRYHVTAVAGTDDNGHELEFYGVTRLLNTMPENMPGSVPDNPDYDTDTLRHEASFMLQVGDGVWWVPVNALGETRYTNREIAGMTEHSPEQKQEEISTLYEAVQLFQISGFSSSEDNVHIPEGELDWEHHKPGYDAVRTNTGCCASCTDWLNYILSDDYEQMGFIGWSWADGNGHVFNYIVQDGWYYFIDLTHYEEGYMTPETGSMAAYRYLEYPAGSVHMARSPEAFVKYYLTTFSDPPARFELYQAENVIPVAVTEEDDGRLTVYYPEEYDIVYIDGVNPETLEIRTVKGPEKTYRWSGMKSAKIRPKKKYLGAEEAAGPLTAYRPGDRLELEDRSAKGTAVVDGIKYSVSRRDEVTVSFEASLQLDGVSRNGVYNLRLPLKQHGEAMKDMNSVVLGEVAVSVVRAIPETQIVICVREDDHLTVQEVMDGKYYDSRRVGIRRDGTGSWADSSDYWYLIITRTSGKLKYEFGRFFCGVSEEP